MHNKFDVGVEFVVIGLCTVDYRYKKDQTILQSVALNKPKIHSKIVSRLIYHRIAVVTAVACF